MQDKYCINAARRLAKNLTTCRKHLKLSQKELSEKSGVSIQNIGCVENMRNSPSVEVVSKIANSLNTDICLLFARRTISFPGTGKRAVKLNPNLLEEGEASLAFWTKEEGMEYHRISNNKIQNALYMMALLQANGVTGKDLLNRSKKLHIPFKV